MGIFFESEFLFFFFVQQMSGMISGEKCYKPEHYKDPKKIKYW